MLSPPSTTKLCFNSKNNNDNVRFNSIIPAGQSWQFFLIRSCHFYRTYAYSLLQPYRFISFFTHSCYNFLGRRFFFFSVISSSITSRIWKLMSPRMTWPYHRRRFWIRTTTINSILKFRTLNRITNNPLTTDTARIHFRNTNLVQVIDFILYVV